MDVVESIHFRRVVGNLASGVTVLTTSEGRLSFGMTASSVTSLSLDPPMMLACVNNAVPTSAAIVRVGRFAINVLAEGQDELAYQFASPSPDKFRDVSLHRSRHNLPLLTDALAQFECSVVETVVGGTHTVFLASVESASAKDGSPLTYFRGRFGRFEFAHDDEAYERARAQVLSLHMNADGVVTVADLAEQLSVERSSAFYALNRLASDGLVRRDPDHGYVISPFDVKISDETFDARLAIELGVIDLAVGRQTESELIELRRLCELMASYIVADRFTDFQRYLDANYSFHEFLVTLAQNPLLTSTFGRLSIKSVMTQSFGLTAQSSQTFVDVQRELTQAFEDRDASAARRAAYQYCELAKARVREIRHIDT